MPRLRRCSRSDRGGRRCGSPVSYLRRNGDRCSCARCGGWRQFAVRSPWSGRRWAIAGWIFESKNTLAGDDPIRALPQLVRQAGTIFGNATKSFVSTCLQRGQHPVEQLQVGRRSPDGFRFNCRLVEIKSTERFRNLLLSLLIREPCMRKSFRLVFHLVVILAGPL